MGLNPPIQESGSIEAQLLSASIDGILAFDRDYRYIYWNSAMEKISGKSKAQVLGKYAFDLFPFIKEIGEDRYLRLAFEGQSSVSKNRPYWVPETARKGIFEGYYSPLLSGSGEIIGAICIVRDVTVHIDWEQKLRESEERFRVMADCAPVALWMARKDSLCDFFNQGWLTFTGRSQEQEFGVGWAEGIFPDDFQKSIDFYLDSFNERKPFSMEYRLRRYDGTYRWILDSGVPRYSPDGTFMGFIGSCTDITDQKNAIETLAQSVKQLKRALKMREDFLLIASHELATPLTPIKLQLQTMKKYMQKVLKELPHSDVMAKMIAVFDGNVDKLSKLVENLLDVTRIEAGTFSLRIEEVDFVQVVHEVIQRLQMQLKEAQCDLKIALPSKLVGQWDKLRLEQVVVNLLTNALKYGARKPIHISLTENDGKTQLIVRDHGEGISKEDQKRIFNPFERAAPVDSFGGLGLGLFITKQIVQAFGGTIHVESEPGKGSIFVVEMPLKSKSVNELAA